VTETPQLIALVDRLAQWFEDHQQVPEELASGRGWGQFLDSPVGHAQIGLYGTSAGIIVRSLANRGSSSLSDSVTELITRWWAQRHSDVQLRRFLGQIPRLAFLNLALRTGQDPNLQQTAAEVRNTLLQRLLPGNLWGNYWISDQLQDPTPRLVPSAIALLSLTLFSEAPTTDETLLKIANELEQRLIGASRLPVLHATLVATAILSAKGPTMSRKAHSRLARIAYSGSRELGDLGVYFYEYWYPDEGGNTQSGRDYFIVPIEILLGIVGRLPSSPGAVHQRSREALNSLIKSLGESDGAYRAPEQRVSSKNQAWAAMLLKLAMADAKIRRFMTRFLLILVPATLRRL